MLHIKRPLKNSLNIGLAALAVTLLGVIAVAAGAAANSKSGAASSSHSAGTGVEMQGAEAWPAFAMVFREEVYEWETGKVAGAETYRYLFNGSEDWQLELLESTRNPRTVGSRTTYKNATLTDAGMVDGQPVPVRTTKSDRPYMATWWLVPLAAERLGAKGSDYQRSADASDGKIRLYKDETAPCSSVSDVWQARLCGDGKQSYTQRTEKVMDPEHGIPLEIIGKTEGKVSSIIKVVELTYK